MELAHHDANCSDLIFAEQETLALCMRSINLTTSRLLRDVKLYVESFKPREHFNLRLRKYHSTSGVFWMRQGRIWKSIPLTHVLRRHLSQILPCYAIGELGRLSFYFPQEDWRAEPVGPTAIGLPRDIFADPSNLGGKL